MEEEEVEEEEEEEDGIELEEVVFNGVSYYKDGDDFIYKMENEELSDTPVGIWKDKTKSIVFYRTKK